MTTKTDKADYITATSAPSIGGAYFAVHMIWVEDEVGKYWDVWQSGVGRYKTRERALEEAKEWARSEGLEFRE